MMKVGVLRFPGTNCDRDIESWLRLKSYQINYLWHLDQFNDHDFDSIVIPGGFSYGDYLRSGALAAKSPVMKSVRSYANKGKPILGICNGFQILCEAGLLPGALVKNEGRRFIDKWVQLKLRNQSSYFLKGEPKTVFKLPVAHGDGKYYIDADGFKLLQDQQQIWLEYIENPNGSLADIAGVFNRAKNIAGLMPHPERAVQSWMGSLDGLDFL